MEGGTAIQQCLKHMKDITDILAAIKAAFSEETQVPLLGSLPDNYTNNLVTALETRRDNLSLEFVKERQKHRVNQNSAANVRKLVISILH